MSEYLTRNWLVEGLKRSKQARNKEHVDFLNKRKKTKKEKLTFAMKAGRLVPSNKEMPYQQFLLTKYWKYVSETVKIRANKACEKCGEKKHLHVHHKKYPERFTEHRNMKLLQCLCSRCHAVEHGLRLPREYENELQNMENRFAFLVDN